MRTQLCRWLFLLGIMAAATIAQAQQRLSAQLVAEQTSPAPGTSTSLAIDLRPATGWHGYWLNPGDAGTPPQIDWTLPNGVKIAALRYPVPQTLLISGLMNHVYEQEYALLTRLTLAPDITPGTILPIRAHARWLVCSDTLCVPEQADLAIDLTAGQAGATMSSDPRFDSWRAKLPRPLGAQARFEVKGDLVRIAIPYPATAKIAAPHFFALTSDLIDYAKPQHIGRHQDLLIVELTKAGFFTPHDRLNGLLAIGPDQGLDIEAVPGAVPAITTEEGKTASTPIARIAAALGVDQPATDITQTPTPISLSPLSLWLALGSAILGGLLLNLMPCVFPILSLKAMSLIRAGASKSEAQREGLAYLAGAVIGTTALGGLLLLLRATGEQAGWAFQLQYPTTILVLYALMAVLTANLAGWVTLPAIVTGQKLTQREGAWGALFTGMLAAFVATPCTGPFLGAALGAALVLPTLAALGIFAGLGLGIAMPFVAIGFLPALRTRLPKPGGWMERVKHWLALPMGLTAVALLWLLWRQAALPGLAAASAMTAIGALFIWRRQGYIGLTALTLGFATSLLLGLALPTKIITSAPLNREDAVPFNETALATLRQSNTPVFLYFTADWCITCKVNEAAAIDRANVRAAFKAKGIQIMIGDWTRGDPTITRFLESQGRSGVPLYLYYPAKGAAPQTLPQLLTPDMLLGLG